MTKNNKDAAKPDAKAAKKSARAQRRKDQKAAMDTLKDTPVWTKFQELKAEIEKVDIADRRLVVSTVSLALRRTSRTATDKERLQKRLERLLAKKAELEAELKTA